MLSQRGAPSGCLPTPAGVIDVPAAHSQQLGGPPLGKGDDSIVQICTLLTLLAGLVGLGLRVSAGGPYLYVTGWRWGKCQLCESPVNRRLRAREKCMITSIITHHGQVKT